MGFSENLREKIKQRIPKEIKEPVEKRIEQYKGQRQVRKGQEKVLHKLESQAKWQEEKRQAKIQGKMKGEKGPLSRQIGKAFLKELTKRPEDRTPDPRDFVAGQFSGHPGGQKLPSRPRFASERTVSGGQARPFIGAQTVTSDRPSGIELAFHGPLQQRGRGQQPMGAVERAILGGPIFGGQGPAQRQTTSVERAVLGQSLVGGQAPAQRQPSAIERAFYGEPTVQARKRMIRGKRKPMF